MNHNVLALLISMIAGPPTQQPSVVVDSIRVEALAASLPWRPAKAITEILPSRWADFIASADSIECFLLCPNWDGASDKCPKDANATYFNPFASRQYGGSLTEGERSRLKTLILDPSSYSVPQGLGDTKGCVVDYNIGYVLTVTSERSERVERIMLSVCHSCLVLSVYSRGSNITVYVDYAGDELLEMTKSLFPNDSEVDQLYQRFHGKYRHSRK